MFKKEKKKKRYKEQSLVRHETHGCRMPPRAVAEESSRKKCKST